MSIDSGTIPTHLARSGSPDVSREKSGIFMTTFGFAIHKLRSIPKNEQLVVIFLNYSADYVDSKLSGSLCVQESWVYEVYGGITV